MGRESREEMGINMSDISGIHSFNPSVFIAPGPRGRAPGLEQTKGPGLAGFISRMQRPCRD